jgi:hypothetical protein
VHDYVKDMHTDFEVKNEQNRINFYKVGAHVENESEKFKYDFFKKYYETYLENKLKKFEEGKSLTKPKSKSKF